MSTRWPILRYLLTAHLLFLLLSLGAFVAISGLILGGVALFGTVSVSALDVGVGQFFRWMALGYGGHLFYTFLPHCLVHGRTRGEFVRQVPVYQVVGAAVLALAIAVLYVGETLLYRAAGWTQGLRPGHLYESGTDFGAVFVSYWAALLVWTVVGSMIGAAWYRFPGVGVLLVPVAAAILFVNGLNLNIGEWGPLSGGLAGGPWGLVGIAAVSTAVAVAVTWSIARDVPVHVRTA
ncbi:hypothetical protein [Cryptosporangium arvum]|uniref:Uncharacterized protein n=1 Tax=Cryptosporangium arvum DSM 44712 TaxID=927661 RepID=A0A011AIT2_9ACTN|nr:hypothetical protein [Cryptosporangium arvum]EXG81926.1 hypothetical protein CryarDRAFT_3051 [Cryptosporangium arvum DSM 44712]